MCKYFALVNISIKKFEFLKKYVKIRKSLIYLSSRDYGW